MQITRITGIAIMLVLSAFLPVKTVEGVDLLFPHLMHDTEAVFVSNYRGLVPMWVGQLFLVLSFFLRGNLLIQAGLVCMGLGWIFFLNGAYKDIDTIQIIINIVFPVAGGIFYWWLWKIEQGQVGRR